MSAASIGFRWLEILEKEFDKSLVDLDLLIGELESEDGELLLNGRQKMATLSSCFAQLSHKSQTVFQNNAKMEAELVHLRTELTDTRSFAVTLEKQLRALVLQFHAAQVEALAKRVPSPVRQNPNKAATSPEKDEILKRLEHELLALKENSRDPTAAEKLRQEVVLYQQENISLRRTLLALQAESSGARLAARYLDKELAGRIQQLQLLGREMRPDVRDKLWNQLEAEIHLHRHKTVLRACRSRLTKDSSGGSPSVGPPPPQPNRDADATANLGGGMMKQTSEEAMVMTPNHDQQQPPKPSPSPSKKVNREVRVVSLRKDPAEGLGISITGGREHGVPILVSEVHADGPAFRSKSIFVGDAILTCNGTDLRQALHQEAVNVLSAQSGQLNLELHYLSPGASDDEDDYCGDEVAVAGNGKQPAQGRFRYSFFNEEVTEEKVVPLKALMTANGNASANGRNEMEIGGGGGAATNERQSAHHNMPQNITTGHSTHTAAAPGADNHLADEVTDRLIAMVRRDRSPPTPTAPRTPPSSGDGSPLSTRNVLQKVLNHGTFPIDSQLPREFRLNDDYTGLFSLDSVLPALSNGVDAVAAAGGGQHVPAVGGGGDAVVVAAEAFMPPPQFRSSTGGTDSAMATTDDDNGTQERNRSSLAIMQEMDTAATIGNNKGTAKKPLIRPDRLDSPTGGGGAGDRNKTYQPYLPSSGGNGDGAAVSTHQYGSAAPSAPSPGGAQPAVMSPTTPTSMSGGVLPSQHHPRHHRSSQRKSTPQQQPQPPATLQKSNSTESTLSQSESATGLPKSLQVIGDADIGTPV